MAGTSLPGQSRQNTIYIPAPLQSLSLISHLSTAGVYTVLRCEKNSTAADRTNSSGHRAGLAAGGEMLLVGCVLPDGSKRSALYQSRP